MKRTLVTLITLLTLATALLGIVRSAGQPQASASDTPTAEQWEYLVVAGGTVNLNPSDSATLRKSPTGAFTREAFPLEQNMDKLGAKGWELVSVSGSPADPIFYFKRRK
ncbi:MAG TPA: hypothetical protein VNS63_25770 [Blastocatellia bacterium]|nr:hypothetical protein [Blastocatellia bacterium]